jgi:SAM-dependent methyltransferase
MSSPLQRLLFAHWLRPETALWRAIDIRAMEKFEIEHPSLDLGCGDGIFSFIRAGGAFHPLFDVFQTVANLDTFFDKVDVFDAFDGFQAPDVLRTPDYRISCAFDHKENLLRKAGALEFYEDLRQGDANEPLPFADASFKSAFSNIVYWLRDPNAALRELARVLMPGGRCCLMLPNPSLRDFSFYYRYCVSSGDRRFAFLEQLDRGRILDNVKHARSDRDWRSVFESVGLSVVDHRRHLSKVVVQTWDIGLRPLFPVLRKLAQIPNRNELLEIKTEWVETLERFLAPLVDLDPNLDFGEEHAFHCYIVQK